MEQFLRNHGILINIRKSYIGGGCHGYMCRMNNLNRFKLDIEHYAAAARVDTKYTSRNVKGVFRHLKISRYS